MSNRFVLDASLTLAPLFLSSNQERKAATYILDRVGSGAMLPVVPQIWHYEIAVQCMKRSRQSKDAATEVTHFLDLLDDLLIETIFETYRHDFLIELARSTGAQVGDSIYIALAKNEGIPVASLDRGMVAACKRTGVEVIGL